MTHVDRLFEQDRARQMAALRAYKNHVNRTCGTIEAPGLIPSAAGASISPDVKAPAPIPDCALAKAARRHARWRAVRRSAINLVHGLGMGALIVGAFWLGAYLGG